MLKPHEIKLAEQAAEELSDSPPRSGPQGDPCDSPQSSLETHRNAAGSAARPTTGRATSADGRWSPSPSGRGQGEGQTGSSVPLSEQLEHLRKHLRQAHELVGRELYAICEARIARLTPADASTLKTGLMRIGTEINEIEQMVQQLQISIAMTGK